MAPNGTAFTRPRKMVATQKASLFEKSYFLFGDPEEWKMWNCLIFQEEDETSDLQAAHHRDVFALQAEIASRCLGKYPKKESPDITSSDSGE